MNITKHDQILQYISGLPVGQKISVRQLAKKLNVSEGTAYRAIKEAEHLGYVSTRKRIGTVRIERKPRDEYDELTFAEVVNIINGSVLGGTAGLDKTLGKLVIGAMEIEEMSRYIDAGGLLIVGNRPQAHKVALERGAGVLITGGFSANEEIIKLADELALPIISSSYDTFTVASMINRAIDDRLIKKKILLVEDLISSKEAPKFLRTWHTVEDWSRLAEETGQSRYPVVDEWNRVLGIVTSKDMIGAKPGQPIEKLMTRHPRTVQPKTSLASAAHTMVWEGIELLPIVDRNRKLIGTITRQDVLKTMQFVGQQTEPGVTYEELVWSSFAESYDKKGKPRYKGVVLPQMTSHLGTVSEGVLVMLITRAAYGAIKEHKKGDLILDNVSVYFIKPLQIDSEIEIIPDIIEMSRKFGKVDVEIRHGDHLVCKAMLTAQVL